MPVILARLSLPADYASQASWDFWQKLNQERPDLYHFRSIFDVRLNQADQKAQVPGRSHLILPVRYNSPQQHGNWYIWRIEQTWFCARPWGTQITFLPRVSNQHPDYQALVAIGDQTAWITDMASVHDYPDFQSLTQALDQTQVRDRFWQKLGLLEYTSLGGDRLTLSYNPTGGIGEATVNGKPRTLKNWDVLNSPYVQEKLRSGVLSLEVPHQPRWKLKATLTKLDWEQ